MNRPSLFKLMVLGRPAKSKKKKSITGICHAENVRIKERKLIATNHVYFECFTFYSPYFS